MKSIKSMLMVLGSVSLILLGACGNNNQATNSDSSPTSTQPAESTVQPTDAAKTESSGHAAKPLKGGQVVESGPYHLEFVPVKEDKGTHLDFYLQKGDNHEAIPNAKVTAQVQLPDGTQKTLDLPYDAAGKHYAALLPEKAAGQYQVKMIADVNGEKVNGRFTFNQ
jgi:major membrane immunogen (membrane-anchored lipoprotein)